MESEMIMKFFGYEKDNENLLELKEMSIECDIQQLDKIIDFLKAVKEKHEKVIEESKMCHSHYRDWDKKWMKGMPDIVIVTKQ